MCQAEVDDSNTTISTYKWFPPELKKPIKYIEDKKDDNNDVHFNDTGNRYQLEK